MVVCQQSAGFLRRLPEHWLRQLPGIASPGARDACG